MHHNRCYFEGAFKLLVIKKSVLVRDFELGYHVVLIGEKETHYSWWFTGSYDFISSWMELKPEGVGGPFSSQDSCAEG